MKKYNYTILFLLFSVLIYSQNNPCPHGVPRYLDADHDGLGGFEAFCDNPQNTATDWYVSNHDDCDDSDPLVGLYRTWYADNDGDGFGFGANGIIYQCAMPTVGGIHYVLDNTDCNDYNAAENPLAIWYLDNDHDGYGNVTISLASCLKPLNYVSNSLDFNDADININILKNWYIDADNDGFGENTSPPINAILQPAGYVGNNLDECPGLSGSIQGCIIPSATTNFGSGLNYILTKTAKKPVTNFQQITNANDVLINITYFDELGRPMQQVASQQSATGKDIITHIEYDAFGRQPKDYLPFASTTSNGTFDNSALSNTLNFAQYTGQNPFSEKLFENSPLNRVMKQAAPGTDWAMGAGHEIKLDYKTNAANEVKRYAATATWDSTKGLYDIALADNGFYDQNQLYKTITFDENTTASPTETNGSTVEFKDKEGKVILKITHDSGTKHETYYIYDIFGNLTYVIPPLVNTANAITTAILDGLCYQYKYDYRNRLVEKKLPGKQWEFMVYDKLDRVVATGPTFSPFTDAVAPNNIGWLITKYDVFNRPVYTGWNASTTVTTAGRVVLQNQQNALTTTLNETRATSTTIDGVVVGYTNVVAPTDFKLLTVNYYDDYNYPNAPTTFGTVLTLPVYYNNTTQKPKGMPTGSWVRVLETNALANAEKSYILYDYKARPMRSYLQNYLGGYTQTDSNIDFAGKTIYTETRHKRIATSTELLVREDFTYTPQDRLLTHTHTINGGVPQLLAKNTYNELGQFRSKNVGGTDVTGATALQKVDYAYNIRGWLTGINDIANLAEGTNPLDLFAFKINYNTIAGTVAGVNKLYNGNIAETYWRSGSDNVLRKYGYNYDQLNRLRNATYQKPDSPNPVSGSYNESLNYDKNGNIMHLDRYGAQDSDSNAIPTIKIDELNYTYGANSNQLQKVADATNSPSGFVDGANTAEDYTYDNNGNMVVDNNKGITQILYNHLNLPTKISFANGGIITYFYNAMGQKVKKVVLENASINTTDYLSGYQYKNDILLFFPTAEGYVNVAVIDTNCITCKPARIISSTTYNYAFNYVDHLGNVRLTYSQDPVTLALRIMEENHYYPFGLKHSGYNSDRRLYTIVDEVTKMRPAPALFTSLYNYKFQGQERQDELGLNWDSFKWRNYDPAIGRFMSVDPLAEKFPNVSPYAFCLNNPVRFTDPTGMSAEDPIDNNSSQSMYRDFMNGYDGSRGLMGSADGDPVKKGQGTDTGNAQHTGSDGLPNGVDLPATELNEVVITRNKTESKSEAGGWYEPAGKANVAFGTAALILEKGSNKFGALGGLLGRASFWGGVGMDAVGAGIYLNNPNSPNAVHPAKAGVNTAVGALGLWGENPIGATLYFGVDAFYPGGWTGNKEHSGAIMDMDRNYQENRAIDPTWQMFPAPLKQ